MCFKMLFGRSKKEKKEKERQRKMYEACGSGILALTFMYSPVQNTHTFTGILPADIRQKLTLKVEAQSSKDFGGRFCGEWFKV